MKIKSVRIQNLRSFKDETIFFENYTCFVGPNGSGKSTVLCALNIFFRETSESPLNLLELQEEDFHAGDTSQPIVITVTFHDLDDSAREDFANYYRQNELVVSVMACFDSTTKRAPVIQYGKRKGIKSFAKYFEDDKQKVSVDELKEIYSTLKSECPDLPPPSTKPKMMEALRNYEENHPELTELIPSQDQFYGFSKGVNRLARHIQWIFVPAVKDASTEQTESKDTALSKLLARTVRARVSFEDQLNKLQSEAQTHYQNMLELHQNTLDEISNSLKARLSTWAHPDAYLALRWQQDPEKSVRIDEPYAQIVVGEGKFKGNLSRFGHGLQRAYLLALLQELSRVSTEAEPTLILAVEEPEIYQHPPQCRHMAKTLQELATNNAQVLITTHSPIFISGDMFESVRMVRKDPVYSEAKVSQVPIARLVEILASAQGDDTIKTPRGMLAKIYQSLQPQLNEIFFSPFLVLVEGREDIAYIITYINLLGHAEDLHRFGCHFVSTDKKSSLLTPFAIVRDLGIPTFIVFDSDGHQPDKNGSREKNRKDNLALLRIAGISDPDPFPSETFWGDNVVMWSSEIDKIVESEVDAEKWRTVKEKIEAQFGFTGNLNKNPLFIAELLESTWKEGLRVPSLEKLCESIIKFCSLK